VNKTQGKEKKRTSGTYVDVEREGGMCTSAGDTGVGVYAEAGAEVEEGAGPGEGGGGSLATLVSCGGATGERVGVWAG
jgi:hypothetical protein